MEKWNDILYDLYRMWWRDTSSYPYDPDFAIIKLRDIRAILKGLDFPVEDYWGIL